jgi:uncharacterized protein (TIGR02588 family)
VRRNPLEWIVLAASAFAIAIVVGYLAFDGIAGGTDPADPAIRVQADEAYQSALGWVVPATMSNRGDEAAEAVVVEATAMVGGKEETTELEVDFLPPGTDVEVRFGFSARPDGEVEVRLVGFRTP